MTLQVTRPATAAEITGPHKALRHGIDCPKALHFAGGDFALHHHESDDDRPYHIEGTWYCGRCHAWLGP